MTMNAHQSIKRPQRLLAGFVAIVAVGMVLANPPSASAHRDGSAGGSSASGVSVDIVDIVVARKVAAAQDRVDRAWLYR